MTYQIILSEQTQHNLTSLCDRLNRGELSLGQRIASIYDGSEKLDWTTLLDLLLKSKKPCIFAESEVFGDGSDWTQPELKILGDISIALDVTVFDDGEHRRPAIHHSAFAGTLVFTPGALLRNDQGNTPIDYEELVVDGRIEQERFFRLYERRLLPVFKFINKCAAERHRAALVTVPGLGCGQFAGRFQGMLGTLLAEALEQILSVHSVCLDHLKLVRFDPYSEHEDRSAQFGHLTFRVRPLLRSQHPHPQLCKPITYEEPNDDFGDCDLFSIVAWDHVSWPGNDFYRGARTTDDGVKAAATSSMEKITGIRGTYNEQRFCYQPPDGYSDWQQVVDRIPLTLTAKSIYVT